jgi:hypothetical protein
MAVFSDTMIAYLGRITGETFAFCVSSIPFSSFGQFFLGNFSGGIPVCSSPKVADAPTLPADVSFRPAVFVPRCTWSATLFVPI